MDQQDQAIVKKTAWDIFWLANGEKLSIIGAVITVIIGIINTLRSVSPPLQ